jgi:glycogen phosphorylase
MLPISNDRSVAYFSMEIALDSAIPTYSGGLGVLAGDTLRSAADISVPMVAITLLHRLGYFRQKLDANGNQSEAPEVWNPAARLELLPVKALMQMEGRELRIAIWRYLIHGISGHVVPVYLLDAALPENDSRDQALTNHLYSGDHHHRLRQEALLGLGGLKALEALGHRNIEVYHMNEGHSSLLALGLLKEQMHHRESSAPTEDDVLAVRNRCVFTTHTPVPAGHDKFPLDLAEQILGSEAVEILQASGGLGDHSLNMTYLALRFSHYVNGVAMHHGEVSRGMFPDYPVRAITNGVHALTWTCPAFRELYDHQIPEWRRDNLYLRYAIGIPLDEIAVAHKRSKRVLFEHIQARTGVRFQERVLTIGFARRATPYKRANLLFSDLQRLRQIAQNVGPIQIVYAGKAHPADGGGKETIRQIFEAAAALRGSIPVVYLENYDVESAKLLTSGVDLWLNTPQRPQEASGTSGMKAALNGVPSLSIMDGWWIEGCIEGVTGWAIGSEQLPLNDASDEIASLYDKLERVIVPLFYGRPSSYAEVMRSAIALNGSFFNTERMVKQYLANAYIEEAPAANFAPAAVPVETL